MMKKNKEVGECIIKFMSSKPDGIPKTTEKRQYNFPRKAFIRFVVKDGKCFGSGGIKQYDEKRSFLYFSYVDGTDKAKEVEAELIKHLEEDAKNAGSSLIFANISNDEFAYYSSLGYSEIERISDERIVELQGAHVIFDKTMAKEL